MSEEEKKAIEVLKNGVGIGDFVTIDWVETELATNTVLNLIEKQQKEIENSVSKDKIRETVNYLDSECSHNFDNEYWVTMGAIRNKFDELLEE